MIRQRVDLEQKLKESSYDELWKDLQQIKAAAQQIWQTPKLRWYPDHGLRHSHRIIELIGQIVEPLYRQNPIYFPPDELFVLLASCYLHDIGMQDLRVRINEEDENSPLRELTPKDFDLVRSRHPKRSAEIIHGGTFKIGEDFIVPFNLDRQWREAIMVISEAHGTDYFSNAVNHLSQNPPAPRGRPIRGPLLAALLLMGDELHLHEERVSECLRWETFKMQYFPPLSLLHIYRHHYINLVEVGGHGDFERKIILRFQFPKDSENYADQIIKWVVTKLRRQCLLTQDILQSSTGLFWSDEPQVLLMEDSRGVRDSLPPVACRCLEKETRERPLVNREELLDKLKGYLKDPQSGNEVLIAWGEEDSDLTYLTDWLQAACECYPGVCLPHLSCYDGCNFGEDYIRYETEALLQPESRGILIIKNLQYLESTVRRWLLEQWLVTITAPGEGRKNIVVIFGENGQPSLPSSLRGFTFNLHNFNESDIIKTLTEKWACPTAEAQRHARSWVGNNFRPHQVINSICMAFGES